MLKKDVLVFSLIVSTCSMFGHGYLYGHRDQIPQLAMIFRILDDTYLVNDFIVNASTDFGPRTYYKALIAWWSGFIPLPALLLGLCWLSHFIIVHVIYWTAWDLCQKSDLTAMLACTLSMAISSVSPGEGTQFFSGNLVPAHMVLGISLWALWAGLRLKPLSCCLAATAASFIHPLVGAETGLIGLGIVAWAVLLGHKGTRNRENGVSWKIVAHLVIGLIILLGTMIIFWSQKFETSLSAAELIDLFPRFRAPHHYIPSYWDKWTYVLFICFMGAIYISWKSYWKDTGTDRDLAIRLLVTVAGVIGLLIGGYVFVELLPTRLWVSANTFRLVYIIKFWDLSNSS